MELKNLQIAFQHGKAGLRPGGPRGRHCILQLGKVGQHLPGFHRSVGLVRQMRLLLRKAYNEMPTPYRLAF